MSGGKQLFSFPPRPFILWGEIKVFPPGGSNMGGGNTRSKYIQKRTCAAGEKFWDWWAVTSTPQAKFLVILNTEMRFPKGKSMIWGFDFSKFSLPPSWVGNPVEISKFSPPYGGKIPEVFPPRPSGVGGGGNSPFPPTPLGYGGGETCRFGRFPPTWGKKSTPG